MGSDGAHAADLVGRDGDAETSAANQDGTVDFTGGDELGGADGNVGVGGLVVLAVGADVDDGRDTAVLGKVGLDGLLVADTGFLEERRVS